MKTGRLHLRMRLENETHKFQILQFLFNPSLNFIDSQRLYIFGPHFILMKPLTWTIQKIQVQSFFSFEVMPHSTESF